MIKIKLPFCLLLLSLFLAACGGEKKTEPKVPDHAEITGVITNPKNEHVEITGPGKMKDTIWMDESGMFSGDIKLDSAGEYRFFHGGEYARIYLTPGDSLNLTVDSKEFDETLTFQGDGAAINNYFVEQLLKREEWDRKYPARDMHELDPEVFVSIMDSIYDDHFTVLAELKEAEPDRTLVKKEELSLLFRKARQLYMYEPRRKRQLGIDEVKLPGDFYAFMNELDLNDPDNLESDDFKMFMETYLFLEAMKTLGDEADRPEQVREMLSVIDEKITNEEIKEELYTGLITDAIKYSGLEAIDSVMPKVRQVVQDSSKLAQIDKLIAQWEALAPGQPAPGFSAVNTDGEVVSLSDLKGSLVYVDVWATWCAPCRAEIPFLEEMHETMAKENVTIVSVSIDEDKEAWKEMVTEDEMVGMQLHISGTEKEEFTKSYHISGIPRFMLFDTEGNIIDVKAPRPSQNAEEVIREKLTAGGMAMN